MVFSAGTGCLFYCLEMWTYGQLSDAGLLHHLFDKFPWIVKWLWIFWGLKRKKGKREEGTCRMDVVHAQVDHPSTEPSHNLTRSIFSRGRQVDKWAIFVRVSRSFSRLLAASK